ncbi:MAG: DNA helicase PcrA [Patescibacteria group bacterium]|nr:MAG: DNA helicase PcrA [Patescibacteria group bacterium]
MEYLNGLNPAQKEAVLHKEGPLLIVAGAGTGKTRTLTHRIIHLIAKGIAPEHILAITFTNKAAKEMRERVTSLLSLQTIRRRASNSLEGQGPFVSTFHALGVHILRESGECMGITRHFTILDKKDALATLKEVMKSQDLDPKQFATERLARAISVEKGKLTEPRIYAEAAGNQYFPRILSSVWLAYEISLKKQNALDFDDLIVKTVMLLKNHSDIRTHYLNRWRYIHIDEYQDTNTAQYELAKLLVGEGRNICAVGDSDQNIYGWRGANIQNILGFEKNYPGAKMVVLEENYRSTQNILAVANDIIRKNKIRKEKNLFTNNDEGEKISLFEAYDETDEAAFVAEKAGALMGDGAMPKNIAVLYRANFQSRVLEEAFLASGIPYQVLGVKFFERKEVKDMLAFIKAALNSANVHDMKRVINVPPRGIGKVTLARMSQGREGEFTRAMAEKVAHFRNLLASIKKTALKEKTSRLIMFILQETGLEKILREGSDEDKERLENIRELVTLAGKYDIFPPEEGVERLLSDAALATDQDSLIKEEGAVKLMTVHAAKGLEFPYVFITGLEQDLFPHKKMGETEIEREQEEEERRLFYVALTRAKRKLFLSYASLRTIFGAKQINIPSEFITDIDENFIEQETRDEIGVIDLS